MAVSPFLTGPAATSARSPGDATATLSAAAHTASRETMGAPRTVTYRGLRIPVPDGWRVHRLDRDPERCVRYDRRAIYLGSPGSQAGCPAHLVGAEDVLHVTPAASRGAERRRGAARASARLARHTVRPAVDHQTRLTVPEAGVTINGRYGDGPEDLQRLIRSTSVEYPPPADDIESYLPGWSDEEADPGWYPSEQSGGYPERPWVKGKGFDTCAAPSLHAMRAWRPSFKVSNIYIGGAARACAQPNLTRSWVSSVRGMGYRLIPTYVGPQAPCARYRPRFTAGSAAREGREAAVDAVRKAKALGIPRGKPIYYDMEYYWSADSSCRKAVMTFLHNWTVKLKALRYVPGVYGSVSSVVRDLAHAKGIRRPTALWFAHWDGKTALYGHPMIPDDLWRPHRRIKQYRGGHKETHGGVTINIDSNQVDGRVY
ncbi:DUF1906 domain-containing protein [Actinomadura sp. SCN-SB]|uniref:DUF1906 domain-containing protein n=1 Tax=Actinomadura sp. SCN-SB TaxID=3373092 RepID=UPI0037500C39